MAAQDSPLSYRSYERLIRLCLSIAKVPIIHRETILPKYECVSNLQHTKLQR